MASNLPPGVTESMLPGNRPEDRECEFVVILSAGEMDQLENFAEKGCALHDLPGIRDIVKDIVEQYIEQQTSPD